MARLSISDVWDDTVRFLAREKALVFPIGFATFGIGLLISMVGVPEATQRQMEPGPWMLWLIPVFLLGTIGYLALSAIVLRPGISVQESLALAFKRLPAALTITAMLIVGMVILLMVAGLVIGLVGAAAGLGVEEAAVVSVAFALPILFWCSVRLVAMWPLLVSRPVGAFEALREGFRLSKGHGLRIAGVMLLGMFVYLLVTGVAQLIGGSLFLLLGKMLGDVGVGRMLSDILVAAVASMLATVWSVFVALLYGRLTSSKGM